MGIALDAAVHDLLRLAPSARLVDLAGDAQRPPPWVGGALRRQRWVVVRRDLSEDGRLPVGVRGEQRRHRYAAWVEGADVVQRVTPEELAARDRSGALARRGGASWTAVLRGVDAAIGGSALAWGPVGSVGFELATRTVATRATSDLDVLIRAPSPIAERGEELDARLHEVSRRLGIRVDCLVETPAGGVHLHDLSTGGPVMARTDHGPLVILDPWRGA
jgi:phosphoribosyl-dephospho-CoA transferase